MLQFTVHQRERRLDPTRTITLRRAWRREWRRRLRGILQAATVTDEHFRPGGRFTSFTGEDAIDPFVAYFRDVAEMILDPAGVWQRPFIRKAYVRGIRNANQDLRRAGVRIPTGAAETITNRMIHGSAIVAEYQWAERAAEKIITASVERLRERLRARVAEPAVLAHRPFAIQARGLGGLFTDELRETLQKGAENSAERLVTRATVETVAEGTLNRFQETGVRLVKVEPEFAFTTAGDERVCADCLALESQDNGNGPGIFTEEQARGIIPVHWGCRCAWTGVNIEVDPIQRRILEDDTRFERQYEERRFQA